MNKLLKTGVLVGLLSVSMAALAIQGQPFVGVDIGRVSVNLPDLDTAAFLAAGADTTSSIKAKTAFHVDGGYLFNLSQHFQLGPEIGYTQYGTVGDYHVTVGTQADRTTYKGHYIDLLAKAVYAFNSSWNIFAKLGVARVTQVRDWTGDNIVAQPIGQTSTHKIAPEFVFGGSYELNQNVGFDLSASYITGDNMNSNDVFDYNPSTGDTSIKGQDKVAAVMSVLFGVHYNF